MSREVRRLVAAELSGARLASVTPLGSGLDHAAYLVDGDLVVRLGQGAEREARLLEAVAEICQVPVPAPLFATATAMAYRLLPGVPLIDLPKDHRDRHATEIARTLGGVLARLWAAREKRPEGAGAHGSSDDRRRRDAAAERLAELADRDDTPLENWRNDAAERVASLAGELPPEARSHIHAFLAAPTPQPATDLVFSHNDLGIEHVLVDPASGTVTGIIDWSDAAFADPARDLGLILRDLGDAALDVAAPNDAGLRDRAHFYARCLVLEDLAYGLQTGERAYIDKSRDGLTRLFAR